MWLEPEESGSVVLKGADEAVSYEWNLISFFPDGGVIKHKGLGGRTPFSTTPAGSLKIGE